MRAACVQGYVATVGGSRAAQAHQNAQPLLQQKRRRNTRATSGIRASEQAAAASSLAAAGAGAAEASGGSSSAAEWWWNGDGRSRKSSSSSSSSRLQSRDSSSGDPQGAAAAAPQACAAGQRGTQPAGGSSQAQQQQAGELPPRERLPRHLAIIMDGNSRWAAARGLPAVLGYRRGVESLRTVVRCCQSWGVPCLTVYAFSSENWRRPPAEVDALLALMEGVLAAELAELAALGVRLRFIGEIGQLPASLRAQISRAELATADNSTLHLTVALSYSGRQDLTLAVQEIARLAAAGQLHPAEITQQVIEEHLATRQLPPAWRHPDLVVRTSGEQRLSNFMLFETAYSELHFSPVMWPDFGREQLAEALKDYATRERRFGGRR